tara:strand:- start:512 stop:826 length:315 start_codon:yes stop_codon:yes gene_type:complete
MDPKETLREIVGTHWDFEENSKERNLELWKALAGWLDNGGFPPQCSTLGIEENWVGGNGFDGERRLGTPKRRTIIFGPEGSRLRKWGNHYAFVSSEGKTYHLPR